MSTGGLFQLITNDGKQDRMLLATALLNTRLLDIEKMRKNSMARDPTPTLVDIERTHILFVNAHFKPYCAIAYEYNVVQVANGSPSLGPGTYQVSIPQFGDFFGDMTLRLGLASVTATNADYWNDPVAHPATGAELLAYVNNLGERIVKTVSFTVNGNPLDEYDSTVQTIHRKYFVQPNKLVGWLRDTQQEQSRQGYCDVDSLANGTADPSVPNSQWGRGTGVREVKYFVDGPQTPKVTQPALEMFIPLLFWFNKDPRLVVPSVSIPYGQRYINFTLASAPEVLQTLHAYDPSLDNPGSHQVPVPDITALELYINNIFVNPEIHDIFIKRIGFNLVRVHRIQNAVVNKLTDKILMNLFKWPIETIYLGFRPTVNNSTSSTLMLTGWNQWSNITQVDVKNCALQNGYLWSFGAVTDPTSADLTAAFKSFTGAALVFAPNNGTVLSVNQINAQLTAAGYPPLIGTFAVPAAPTSAEIIAATPGTQCTSSFNYYSPIINRLRVEAHGIPLYQSFPERFYNSYISYTYGGHNINTPEDVGAYMITFNLYPGSLQPSGYVNLSRAREFYISYDSSVIGTQAVPSADLLTVGIAINFLLISDGSAVLRYAT